MAIRLQAIKNLLWFCTLLLVALSFPVQVYTQSPFPALLPYLLIVLIMLLPSGKRSSMRVARRDSGNINLMVGIYIVLVLLNTAWQSMFGVITFEGGASAIAVYLLPVVFYWYFCNAASEEEIRWSIAAMVVAGLFVGIYFAYDSYTKLALGQLSDYSRAAFEYSVSRAGGSDVNALRVSVGYRSPGLLESQPVSGAWTVIGALATLTCLPRNRRVPRLIVVLLFGTMLFLGLNFTTIIAFSFIMIVLEFGGFLVARHRISSIITNLISLALVVAILAGVALWVAGDEMSEFILLNLSSQTDLALGIENERGSYLDLALEYLGSYYDHVSNFPIALLSGDGFSTFGMLKGGDVGFVETLARFGLPYFLVVVFGLVKLIGAALRQIKATGGRGSRWWKGELDQGSVLQFAVGVTLLVMIDEGHYSVWSAKSVLPIVFFVLALYRRYLPGLRRGSVDLSHLQAT